MKKIKNFLVMLIAITFVNCLSTPAIASDYEPVPMPRIDISQYQDAPRLIWWTGQEVAEDLVLTKDGNVYVPVELFSRFKNTMAFNWLDNQPIAIIQRWNEDGTGPDAIILFALVQQSGEEKPFFIAEDGTTYVRLIENAERIGIKVQFDLKTNTMNALD